MNEIKIATSRLDTKEKKIRSAFSSNKCVSVDFKQIFKVFMTFCLQLCTGIILRITV